MSNTIIYNFVEKQYIVYVVNENANQPLQQAPVLPAQKEIEALDVEYRELKSDEPVREITPKPRPSYFDEIAARYAGNYEQLQRNRAAYIDAEFERVNQFAKGRE